MLKKFYFIICVVAIGWTIFSSVNDNKTKFSDYADQSLTEYRKLNKDQKNAIVKDYMLNNSISESVFDNVHGCLDEMTHKKDKDLNLSLVAGWCLIDYQNDNIAKYVNFETFENGFSSFDGSYRKLETQIKKDMFNDDTYEHVSTSYSIVYSNPRVAKIMTIFKGSNTYNAIVKTKAFAEVDLKTGELNTTVTYK